MEPKQEIFEEDENVESQSSQENMNDASDDEPQAQKQISNASPIASSGVSADDSEMPDHQAESEVVNTHSKQSGEPGEPDPADHTDLTDSNLDGDESRLDNSLSSYDWEDLHKRYREEKTKLSNADGALLTELSELNDFFIAWQNAGINREKERAEQRLLTRTRHVELDEESFEKKRSQYAHFMEAFRGALKILESNSNNMRE